MTSIKRAGRITTFGFSIGASLLIASGAGAAVAAAAPDDSGPGPTSASSTSSGSSPSARSARPANNAAAKPKPARITSIRSDGSAPVIQLHTGERTPTVTAAAASPAAHDISAVPAASATQETAKRAAALPTSGQIQQTIVAGLDAARRRIVDLGQKIQTLVQNQIIGFQDNLVTLRIDLERLFNPNKSIIYGNLANAQYWAAGGAQTAGLMAAAMVITALTGQTVTAQDIIDEATTTPSVVRPNRMMYLGTTTYDWVWANDVVQLMETHGLKTTTFSYTASQEQRALTTAETALSQGQSVIVSINGSVISSNPSSDEVWTTQHQVVLLGIDITKNLVYLNDGANPNGQNLTMSIEDFLDAWQTSRFTTIIAQLAPATAEATDGTIAA